MKEENRERRKKQKSTEPRGYRFSSQNRWMSDRHHVSTTKFCTVLMSQRTRGSAGWRLVCISWLDVIHCRMLGRVWRYRAPIPCPTLMVRSYKYSYAINGCTICSSRYHYLLFVQRFLRLPSGAVVSDCCGLVQQKYIVQNPQLNIANQTSVEIAHATNCWVFDDLCLCMADGKNKCNQNKAKFLFFYFSLLHYYIFPSFVPECLTT